MSNWKELFDNEHVIDIDDVEKEKLEQPKKFHVLLLNDDYTPMDFVVEVLRRFFTMNTEQANDIMLTVHHKGKALCGTYSADIAETKVELVNRFANDNEHPLMCLMEEA